MASFVIGLAVLVGTGASATTNDIHFQAHRGGLKEVPENTLAAYRHAWDLGGIPEVDICSTADKAIICLHDDTLARTTNAVENADKPVSQLTLAEIRKWDAGIRFDPRYRGEKVPTLEEVLTELGLRPQAWIYLDLKNVDLDQLAAMLQKHGVTPRVIFCHNKIANCRKMRAAAPGLRTMLWIGGDVDDIKRGFRNAAADEFRGLDQVQLHLKRDSGVKDRVQYQMDEAFLVEALDVAGEKGIELEVLPFEFDCTSLSDLLDLGIRWFATDEPKRFKDCVAKHFDLR